MAVPASIFFYGVDDPVDAPLFVTASFESEIRERYRRQYLLATVPNRIDRRGRARHPDGDWAEAIGAAYDRRLFVYTVDTTPAQDAAILHYLNTKPNLRSYSLGRANCADFAAALLVFVWPHHPTRNFFADFDVTTPKNLARQADALRLTHPEFNEHVYEIPQVPSTLRRSHPLRGSAETFVKTKRYLIPMLALQPELILTDWILYEAKGRWKPGHETVTLAPSDLPTLSTTQVDEEQQSIPDYSSVSTPSRILSDGIGLRAK